MNAKQKANVGDLVKINYIRKDGNFLLTGTIVEIGVYTYLIRGEYIKLDLNESLIYELEEQYIESLEIIKTKQQILDTQENKTKYPLIINYFTYTISICKNLAQVIIYKATRQNELHIIDLSAFTNDEILNLYNNDKEFLTDLIIKKTNIDNYNTKIDKLLLEASELEEEQDNLYEDIDRMIEKFKIEGVK